MTLLSSCNGSSESVPAGPPKTYNVTPSAQGGSDLHTGESSADAFATITHALAVAKSGDTVRVAAGTFSPGSSGLPTDPGERFPITVKEGVSIIGDPFQPSAAQQGTVLLGSGPYASAAAGSIRAAIVLKKGASMSNLIIRSQGQVGVVNEATATVTQSFVADNHIGIFLAGGGAVVTNNTVSSNNIGIESTGGNTGRIEGNLISDNTGNEALGLRISDASPSLRQNQVTGNLGGGIVLQGTAQPDLGGGGRSDGGNTISCNNSGDLIHNGNLAIMAQNNLWDHVPPSGNDIIIHNGGSVDATGAAQAAQPC